MDSGEGIPAMLTRALLRLGIPIAGVSFGRVDDRTTWRIDYKPEATQPQKDQAEAFKLTYDAATDQAWIDEQADQAIDGHKALKAVVIWAAQKLGIAPATAKAQILAIYKTL